MRNSIKISAITVAMAAMLAGCSRPYPKDEYLEIGPSETAFLIALDGDTRASQAKLSSIAYLEENKVQAKRIKIPHRIVDLCPSAPINHCWQDQPMAKLIKVSRTPVTREWTKDPKTGTSARDEAFHVESNEAIDFTIGASLTAHVSEEGTAKFLFHYAGKQLEEVMDTNMRAFVSSALSREFGSRSVMEARGQKNAIFAKVFQETKDAFEPRGLSLDAFGYAEGMTFSDPKVQEAINRAFEAQANKATAMAQAEAAESFARAKDAINSMSDLEMRKKLVDAQVEMLKKWDGRAPQVVTQDSMFGAMFATGRLAGVSSGR
ncbi:MAG TPA: SPFH domain-containing protein [Methylibium sp.]